MMKLSAQTSIKWNLDESKRLATANNRVTHEDVDNILEAVTRLDMAPHIRVYSGVHGESSGLLQVDDETFYEDDKKNFSQEGDGTLKDPKIEVVKMPLDDKKVPDHLKQSLADPKIVVVLAFCFSRDYAQINRL
jgi:hypothetical protein